MKTIRQFMFAVLFLALGSSLFAQGSMFSTNAILRLNINYLHSKAAWENTNNVATFNLATSNAVLNHAAAPTNLVIESVDDNKATAIFNQIQTNFATGKSVAGLNVEDALLKQVVPVPAGSAVNLNADGSVAIVPPQVPSSIQAPADAVGADQGNGFYGCVAGDTSANGKQYGNSRGVFQKNITATPFGSSCYWKAIVLVN